MRASKPALQGAPCLVERLCTGNGNVGCCTLADALRAVCLGLPCSGIAGAISTLGNHSVRCCFRGCCMQFDKSGVMPLYTVPTSPGRCRVLFSILYPRDAIPAHLRALFALMPRWAKHLQTTNRVLDGDSMLLHAQACSPGPADGVCPREPVGRCRSHGSWEFMAPE